MKPKLTPKQIELLRKIGKTPHGIMWALLSAAENSNGTRLSRRNLTVWVGSGDSKVLRITDAGREALEEIGE